MSNTKGGINMPKRKGLKPGPKRTAESTGKLDQRARDRKGVPGDTPKLKPAKDKK